MAAKMILVICAQAVFIQTALSQVCSSRAAIEGPSVAHSAPFGMGLGLSPLAGPGLLNNGLAARGLPCDGHHSPALEFASTSGGGLAVTSTSAIAPTGITIVSENKFEGPLSIAGELPFMGTTGMEGAMPSTGAGNINHSCGNGVTAMTSDAAIGIGPGAAIPPIAATFPASGIVPVATSYGAAPLAGRFGLSGCSGNVIY
ncbi:hypothetical protein PYW08_011332 [Mythimna loreyi]|uniref:Uncharacterized protein n=1 Tax=Mythimna loreyi TaxID=667449 RepID=A0ACC2Q304_9NEOP|nr:hypothetical protein PYW08_011332 [Mythimna loreyi]